MNRWHPLRSKLLYFGFEHTNAFFQSFEPGLALLS